MSGIGNIKSAIPSPLKKKLFSAKVAYQKWQKSRSPFYRDYPPRTDISLVENRARVSPEWKYVYFRIPKAANSTIIANMLHYEQGVTASRDIVENFKISDTQLSDLTRPDVDSVLKEYYKFTVVRNPYSRLLSAYYDKIVRRTPHSSVVADFLGKSKDESISLSEFLDFLESSSALRVDGHWARQTELIALPLEKLDFIGKCESLDDDLTTIMQRLYGRFDEALSFSPHATGADKKVEACADTDLQRIYKVYEKDFDLLKYPSRAKSA